MVENVGLSYGRLWSDKLMTESLSVICNLWQVPLRAEEITIPADVTPEKVPTHIVDYSGNTS